MKRQHMKALITNFRGVLLIAGLVGCLTGATVAGAGPTNDVRIVSVQGKMEIIRRGATSGVTTSDTNQPPLQPFDRLRTGPGSRVTLLWTDQSPVSFGALTELEILPPHDADADAGLHLIRGILSFFHRDQPGRIRVITRGATAGIKGTEFVVEVAAVGDTERTTLSVLDGIVSFTNEVDALVLTNGQQAVAEPGRAPVRTAGFNANNLLQWCFYYPAVLDVNDLTLTADEQIMLGDSLAEYRAGDLLTALARYPAGQTEESAAVRVYHAALLLSVGQVEQAEKNLPEVHAADTSEQFQRLANALRQLIAAVKRELQPSTISYQLSTEFLAASYYEQSRAVRETSLKTALQLAQQAVTNSPEFGFGWERVAELEFSFGRTDRALEALNKSLTLSPRNAQALALKGFLLAAQNQTREAIEWFDRALVVDSALGNAWLGRGLCRIRRGDARGGREDLLLAAAMEPQRAALRSYLGKAWSDVGDDQHARKELGLAQTLDPNDPTSWLYSALNNEQHNRINDAIRDLEKSQELNDNRAVYRSGLLLDQDRAVRSVNLARIYQEADLDEVGIREAVRAVNSDYANYSSHLFLANSYNALRDPNQINLRYETPTYAEFLLGNLLSPVNAGVFSPSISQQDYSRLFERDRFGVNSSTEYLSRGAWTQSGSQYGTSGNFSYDLEGIYRSDPGQRVNHDIEQQQLSLAVKQRLTPEDTLFGLVTYYQGDGGDLFQYYDPAAANKRLRTHEQQAPLLSIGYHHEWGPGSHTLFLFSRLQDTYKVNNPEATPLILGESGGVIGGVDPSFKAGQQYQSDLVIYSAEAQQVWQSGPSQLIAGLRYQHGDFSTHNVFNVPMDSFYFPVLPPPPENVEGHSERASAYTYYLWRALDSLQLIGGLSYDWLSFPRNYRFGPISDGQQGDEQWSPKAGFIWTPLAKTTVRGAYTKSLSGTSLEQSFLIEPSQVAGFNQLYRSLIPESVAGANAGARFETWGLSLEQKLGQGTYVGVSGEILNSKVDRQVGVFISDPFVQDDAFAATTPEHLDYREQTLRITMDQLLGKEFALGASYRLTHADFHDDFTAIPGSGVHLNGFQPVRHERSQLQQLSLHATFNHPSGFSAQLQSLWTCQQNRGYAQFQGEPGDDFWQMNFLVGYRSPKRRMELTVGVLNLTDQNYKLNPLTIHNELPRARTLVARLKFNF